MTLEKLKTNTRKELAALAKQHQVAGWHGMRKEELIEALLDVHRSTVSEVPTAQRSVARAPSERQAPRSLGNGRGDARGSQGFSSATPRSTSGRRNQARHNTPTPRVVRRDISTVSPHENVQEELIATAHDPFWIHAQWVLKRTTVLRAEAALGAEWFRAIPVIRVHALKTDEVNGSSAQWIRDVEIHGECDHWFVPVENPPGAYKLEVGYATPSGKFFSLARSRRVVTPRPGSRAAERLGFQRNAAIRNSRPAISDPEFEKFLAARVSSYGTASGTRAASGPDFSLDAELVVSGTTEPNCQLMLQGEAIKVGKDGRFTARVAVGDGRQVIPATCVSADGTERRTIFLAVERKPKHHN